MRWIFSFLTLPVILFLTVSYAYGQQADIDSLKNSLSGAETDSAKIGVLKEVIKFYVKSKDYDQAEEYAIVNYEIASRDGSDLLMGKALYNLGIVKWLKNEQTESNNYLLESIPYIISTPDSALLAKCYTKIATNYLRQSDFKKAILYYGLSYDTRLGIGDSTGMANNLINIAGCYYQMAEFNSAIRYYHDALKIAEGTGNLKLAAYNYNNIGNIYLKNEDNNSAIDYFLIALATNRKLDNESEASKNLLNLGNAYKNSGDTANAEKCYLQSIVIKEKLNDQEGLSETYNSLGSIYLNLGLFKDAMFYFQKAHRLIQQSNDRYAEAAVLANIGSVYMKIGQQSAPAYFLRSLIVAQEIKARNLQLNAYTQLIEYYSQNDDYRQLVKYYDLKNSLKDSIYNDNTAHAIAEMKTKYETEKKVQENELLLKDIKIERDTKKFYGVTIMALLILMAAIAYLFKLKSNSLRQSNLFHLQEKELSKLEMEKKDVEKEHLEDKIFAEKQLNRLQREKYEAELARKNEKLANSALCIVNKNEVLNGIKEKILESSNSRGDEQFIPELIREINNNIDIDQNWQKFRLQFEEVHPGFFDKLTQKHPDLSLIFIQLAAYIRINLTTNEIAQLQYITVASVKKSRQRLRKKLDLEAEASLFEYISGI